MDELNSESYTRFKIVISYDGSNYAGWQWQANKISVQQKIEEAIERLFQIKLRIHGSSRTDTGVHAMGMVAHFDIPSQSSVLMNMPTEKVSLALNAFLPLDIRIVDTQMVDSTFHARFSAKSKQYRYFIWNARHNNPILRSTAWHVPRPIDVDLMRQAASHIPGKKDFRSFANHHTYEIENSIRTVFRCSVRKAGPLITIIIHGDGFLYRMCRGIAGTITQVGSGKYQPHEVSNMIEKKNRIASGMTAPAHGLFLWKVYYV